MVLIALFGAFSKVVHYIGTKRRSVGHILIMLDHAEPFFELG